MSTNCAWYCNIFYPKWRCGRSCYPRDKTNDIIFSFSSGFLFFCCFFLSKDPFFVFHLGNKKQSHIPLQITWLNHRFVQKNTPLPNMPILIIVYKPLSAFLPILSHCFQFLQLGFWDVFPKPWKNESKKKQIIVVSKFSSWIGCS